MPAGFLLKPTKVLQDECHAHFSQANQHPHPSLHIFHLDVRHNMEKKRAIWCYFCPVATLKVAHRSAVTHTNEIIHN